MGGRGLDCAVKVKKEVFVPCTEAGEVFIKKGILW